MAFAITFTVCGYHVYKDIWATEIGSKLPCFPDPHIREDHYAVAVMDGTSIVGHVPRKISYICYIFLLHSGSIICHVIGPRQYSPVETILQEPARSCKFLQEFMVARISRQILARVVKILQGNMTAGISSARITLFLREHKNLARIYRFLQTFLLEFNYTLERINRLWGK